MVRSSLLLFMDKSSHCDYWHLQFEADSNFNHQRSCKTTFKEKEKVAQWRAKQEDTMIRSQQSFHAVDKSVLFANIIWVLINNRLLPSSTHPIHHVMLIAFPPVQTWYHTVVKSYISPALNQQNTIYGFCFWISASAPRCWVFPISCCSCAFSCASRSPVRPATAPPTAPETRLVTPEPKSVSCPLASCSLPWAFCSAPARLRFYMSC